MTTTNMRISARNVLAVILTVASCGCASLTNTQVDEPKIFGGTQMNLQAMDTGQYGPLPYLDLPLSFALDTAFLPLTLVNVAVRERVERPPVPYTPPAEERPHDAE